MITENKFALWQGRIYECGYKWRYEIRMPSGGGWNSKSYYTYKGAQKAMRAAIARHMTMAAITHHA